MEPEQNNDYCLNCGTELHGAFCHRCGQKDLPKRQTLWELVDNYIGSTFSFESKFFRSVIWLLFRPGYLPAEYISGRRERYYHPVRAYAFISLVFFFLLFGLDSGGEKKSLISTTDFQKIWEGIYASSDLIRYKSLQGYDSTQNLLPAEKRDGWLNQTLLRTSFRLMERYKKDGGWQEFRQDLGSALEANYPKVFFMMLPIIALVLHLLFIRRGFLYPEHLVFTLYYYNFIYLMASLIMLVGFLPWGGDTLSLIGTWWMALYLPFAMRKMYRQTWKKVWWKTLVLVLLGLSLLLAGSLANVFFSLTSL